MVSWSDGDTAFTLRASVRGTAEAAVLQEGVAVSGAVDEGRWVFPNRDAVATPAAHDHADLLSGDADMYAAVGHRPTRSNWQWGSDHAPEDSPIFHMLDLAGGDIDALGDLGKDALRDMIRDADGSSDVLEIRPGDPHFPAEAPATIEVGVYGAEGRSEFTLLASYGAAARLRDGTPQLGFVDAEGSDLYSYAPGEAVRGADVTFTLTLLNAANADLYVAVNGWPSVADDGSCVCDGCSPSAAVGFYCWWAAGSSSDELTVATDDPHRCGFRRRARVQL